MNDKYDVKTELKVSLPFFFLFLSTILYSELWKPMFTLAGNIIFGIIMCFPIIMLILLKIGIEKRWIYLCRMSELFNVFYAIFIAFAYIVFVPWTRLGSFLNTSGLKLILVLPLIPIFDIWAFTVQKKTILKIQNI